eukprot:355803-Chlamydomonas_euryale.AAC.5
MLCPRRPRTPRIQTPPHRDASRHRRRDIGCAVQRCPAEERDPRQGEARAQHASPPVFVLPHAHSTRLAPLLTTTRSRLGAARAAALLAVPPPASRRGAFRDQRRCVRAAASALNDREKGRAAGAPPPA